MKPWFLVFLVACGDDGGVRPLPDGPTGRITVTARTGQAPAAGAAVYLLGPDSALIAQVLTDANGVAIVDGVVDGSSVTVRSDETTLQTILDVVPNDELVFVSTPTTQQTQVPIQVRATTQPTLNRYLITATCAIAELEGVTSGSLYVDGCATADVLVDVQNDNYDSLEFAYAPDQTVSGALDLSALVYAPTTQRAYTVTDVPEAWHDLHLYRSLSTAKGRLKECESFADEVRCPNVPGATVVDRLTAYDDTVWHESFFPATNTTTSVAFAGLPIETIPTLPALTTNTVTWTGGAGANVAEMTIRESEGDARWIVYGAAPSDRRIALPRLPDGLAFTSGAGVHLKLLDVVGGFAAVRQNVFSTDTEGLATLTNDRVITASYEGGF